MGISRTPPSREILSGDSADVYFARAASILEREGLERHLHAFAFGYPTLYGLMTVAIAIAAGLAASAMFRKAAH